MFVLVQSRFFFQRCYYNKDMILEIIVACIVIAVMVVIANLILGDLRVYVGLLASPGNGNGNRINSNGNTRGSGAADGEKTLSSDALPDDASTDSKKNSGDIASTGIECFTGFAELWDNKGSNAARRCCPTVNVKSIEGLSWCSSLVDASSCMYNEQCESGYCRPGETSSDHTCVPSAMAIAADAAAAANARDKDPGFSVSNAGQCKSNNAALWSVNSTNFGMKCCYDATVVTVGGKTFCADLQIGNACDTNEQCKTGKCGFNICARQSGVITCKKIMVCRTDNASVPVNLLGIDVFDEGGNRITNRITTNITALSSGKFDGDDQFNANFLIDGVHTELDADGNMRVATTSASPNAFLALEFGGDTVISKIVIYNRIVGQTKSRINGCNLVVMNAAGTELLNMPLSDKDDIITFSAPFPAPTRTITCKSIVMYNGTALPTGGIAIRVWDKYGMEIKSGQYQYDPWFFTKLILTEDTVISRIEVKNREDKSGWERINGSRVVARNAAGVGVFVSAELSGGLGNYIFPEPPSNSFPIMTVTTSAFVSTYDQPAGECRHSISGGICNNTISNGEYSFNMQPDGNVVLYQGGVARWASDTAKTNPNGPYFLKLKWDGNLVANDVKGDEVWGTGASGAPGFHTAYMQDDGNLVIKDSSGKDKWTAKTNGWKGKKN